MFKEHYDHMRPGPTPERVLAICRLLSSNPLTEDEIKDRIYLTKTPATKFGDEWDSVKAAAELGLISFKDNVYSLSVDSSQISTVEAFRRTVAARAFSNKNTTFGFNALTGQYVDMLDAGIIDPTKVTRSALENAASVASTLLTTEVLVCDNEEKNITQPNPNSIPQGYGIY